MKAVWDKEAQRRFFDVTDGGQNPPLEPMQNWDEAAAEKAVERGYIGSFLGREINRNFNPL